MTIRKWDGKLQWSSGKQKDISESKQVKPLRNKMFGKPFWAWPKIDEERRMGEKIMAWWNYRRVFELIRWYHRNQNGNVAAKLGFLGLVGTTAQIMISMFMEGLVLQFCGVKIMGRD